MKIILVTSNLTYTPQNYNDVLEFVLSNSKQQIVGIVLVKINLLNVLGKVLFLYISGCRHIANTLARNFINTLFNRKKKIFKKYNIPFIDVKSINNSKAISWLQQIRPDLIINMRARCLYKDTVLGIPRFGCINVHHGILPYQRGLFCDLYAIAENNETGFTIHKMTNKIDVGQIVYQEKIISNKNYMEYLSNVAKSEEVAISNLINKITLNDLQPMDESVKYNNSIVTTTPDFRTIKQLQRKGIIL